MIHYLTKTALLAVLVIPSAMAGWWVRSYHASKASVCEVARGDVLEGVTISGKVEAVDKAVISSEFLAAVQAVEVEEGDRVEPGQVLIRLVDGIIQAECAKSAAAVDKARLHLAELQAGPRPEEIDQAREALGEARVELDFARKDYADRQDLRKQGAESPKQLELAKRRLDVAQAAHKQAQARLALLEKGTRPEQIARARAELTLARAEATRCEAIRDRHVIRAPHGGQVTRVYVQPGEVVSPGQRLLLLHDNQSLRVRAQAQEGQLEHISPGLPARLLADANTRRSIPARVDRVLPRVAPDSGTVGVLLSITGNPAQVGLFDGATVDVALIRSHRRNVPRLPVQAVLGTGDQAAVWVRRGASFVKVPVVLGASDGKFAEVVTGLEVGDVVRVP